MHKYLKFSMGFSMVIVIALLAYFLALYVALGAVSLAIIIGMIAGNMSSLPLKFDQGIKFSETTILSWSIAFMGVNLDFKLISGSGLQVIFLVIAGMIFTLFVALLLGRLFKLDYKLNLLMGVGSAICGSSAIAASQNIIQAKQSQVGISIAIINFLGTLGIFIAPFMTEFLFKFNAMDSGIFIGNTLQAVGQVTAAGFAVSDSTGQTAVVVKMTRILMLSPVLLILLFLFRKKNRSVTSEKPSGQFKIPLFILGFIFMSLIASFNIFPDSVINIISQSSKYLLIIAMAAIGLRISFAHIMTQGKSCLKLGSLIFALQLSFSGFLIVTLGSS